MSSSSLVCWQCGASLEAEPLPLARLAECQACHADVHVCRLCEFYDPGVAKSCREPVAEEVGDKRRANFCGYFQPRPGAYSGKDEPRVGDARAQLEALFTANEDVGAETGEDQARERLEDLFRSEKP